MTTPVLEERRQVVEVGVPRGILIDADAARAAQVLSNLLTNAAKYSDPDSTIRIEGERIGGEAIVRVVDEGMGIAPEMLDRVFDVFVQQPQTLDRSQGGLGLGLTIVKSLVELHGGRVMVSSEGRGKGSIFTVVLPTWASESSHDAQVHEESPESSSRGRRILIVDDNADGAEMLCAALEHLGHRVEVAHDGPSAIGVAERFLPDIALLDIGLPVMDGYELASRLRSESTDASSPRLIAITGYGQEEDRRRTSAAGFDMHLVKPIDFARLVSAIDGSEKAPAEAS